MLLMLMGYHTFHRVNVGALFNDIKSSTTIEKTKHPAKIKAPK